ncbi:MAG: SoxR reducing system RseC family protein [Spirochaetia bacterium]|nr:SoxR reducing system RseC family protein [Spirochaetia bacterium]
MTERAIVLKVEGRTAVVGIQASEGCAHCSHGGDCSLAGARIDADLPEGFEGKPGDEVTLVLPSGVRAAGLLWLLVVPLALFAAGYAAGDAWAGSEAAAAGLGLAGLALGLGVAALAVRRGKAASRPRVLPL